MFKHIFFIIIALFLSACTSIEIQDAKVTTPNSSDADLPKFKQLNNEARDALGAGNPDSVVAVFTDKGVILYGAKGKSFRIVPAESSKMNKPKTNDDGIVTDVRIQTIVHSPACTSYKVGGDLIWYPDDCPR